MYVGLSEAPDEQIMLERNWKKLKTVFSECQQQFEIYESPMIC